MPPGVAWPPATLLGRLAPVARDALLAAGVLTRFPKRKMLIRQGDLDRHVILLLEGFVKVVASTESGYEGLLGIRVGGDLVGELSAIDGEPRSASVISCGMVPARVISAEELHMLVGRMQGLHREISRMMSNRLRRANRHRIDYRAHDAPTRIGRVLVEIAEKYGHDTSIGRMLGVGLTQGELASLAGVALPTLEKALRAFDDEGLIRRANRQLVVIDLPGLRRVAKLATENPY
jgi:CRP-like cAMP-binding protein